MNPFPDVAPPVGQVVVVALSYGPELEAEWDGAQWWSHLNDNPDAAPIANEYVTAWRLE